MFLHSESSGGKIRDFLFYFMNELSAGSHTVPAYLILLKISM